MPHNQLEDGARGRRRVGEYLYMMGNGQAQVWLTTLTFSPVVKEKCWRYSLRCQTEAGSPTGPDVIPQLALQSR